MSVMKAPAVLLPLVLAANGAWAQEPGDARKGYAYAERVCAQCHGIRGSDPASPVAGLATFKTIANTPGMTGTAIAVWLQTPHKAMPNLIVEREDRDNVVAYIMGLRDK